MGDGNSSLLNLVVSVRDMLDCATELDLPTISVVPDISSVTTLIAILQTAGQSFNNNNELTSNPYLQILNSDNQNTISQLLISLAEILNMMAQQNIQTAIASRFHRYYLKI